MKRIVLLFGMISCWTATFTLRAQAPERIYYKFEDSASVVNQASGPVGMSPLSFSGTARTDTGGFLDSKAMADDGGLSNYGGMHTGWDTRINGSFTASFWIDMPDSATSTVFSYIFGDSLIRMHCMAAILQPGFTSFFLFTEGVPQVLPQTIYTVAGTQPHVIHIVYDARPTILGSGDAPFGTVAAYVDGMMLQPPAVALAKPDLYGDGLVIGSSPGGLSFPGDFNLDGKLDEFRFYDRALTATEIANTYDIDISPKGNCPHFSNMMIDSISGEAFRMSWTSGSGNSSYFVEYDTAGFTPGTGNQINGTYPGDPSEVVINGLDTLTEYDVYFGEICGSDSVYNPAPYTIKTNIPCQLPSNLTITDVDTTSISLDWDFIGTLRESYLIYGEPGFDPVTSGETDTLTGTSHTITGLTKGIRYEMYLVANCGSGNGLSDTIFQKFITDCEIFTAPWHEDFDDTTQWVSGIGNGNENDTTGTCWEVNNILAPGGNPNNLGIFNWETRTGEATLGRTPVQDNSGNGNYVMLGGKPGSHEGDISELYSPLIDVSSLNVPYLSFYYYRMGADQPDVYIEVNDGNGWRNVTTLTGAFQTQSTDPYQQTGVNISSFGDTIQIRFKALRVGLRDYMALDDVEVKEAPPATCEDINGIDITGDGTGVVATVGFPEGYRYNLEWGPPGFEQGTGCLAATTDNPYVLDECIEMNAVHDLYVQNNCVDSSLGLGTWSGPFTICGPFSAPYKNYFDGEGYDECWHTYLRAAVGIATQEAKPYFNYGQAFSGSNTLRLFDGNINSGDTTMITTPRFIDMPDGDKQIRFTAYSFSLEGSSQKLVVGTMFSFTDGASFSPLDTVVFEESYKGERTNTSPWREFTIPLNASSGYNGTDQIIAFKLGDGSEVFYIDNFHYEEIPACPAPSMISAGLTFAGDTKAVLNWKTGNSLQSKIEWGEVGFEPGTGESENRTVTSDTFYIATGLTANTEYEYYLRDSCNGGYTPWVGPVSFSTLCTPLAAPFTEDFDGQQWVAPSRASNPANIGDTIDPCWGRNAPSGKLKSSELANYYYNWGVQDGPFGSTSGTLTDHSGSGNFIFTNPWGVEFYEEVFADFYTPLVDVSNLNTAYLSFYYHRFGVTMPDVDVQVNDGQGWETVMTLTGEQQNSLTDPFRKTGVDISGFADTLRVRFHAEYGGVQNSYMSLDNVSIDEIPTCPISVHGLDAQHSLDNSTGTSSTVLSWEDEDEAGAAASYEIWWGPEGFRDQALSLGDGYKHITSSMSQAIDTLKPGSCYEFLVRRICSTGDTSDYFGPFDFCTPCNAIPAPYVQDFHSPMSFERERDCWHQVFTERSSSYMWRTDTTTFLPNTGPEEDASSGDGYFAVVSRGSTGDSAALYSPLIDISTLVNPRFEFAYYMFGEYIDTLHVDLFDGNSWHQNIIEIAGEQQTSKTDAWLDTVFKLDNYRSTELVQVRFRTKKPMSSNNDIAIDNFRIIDSLSCPFPTNFKMAGNTDSTVTLSWVSDTNSENFIIEYGPNGYEYGQGDTVTSTVDSVVIPIPDNRIYEAYLISDCGQGDSSLLVGPIQFYSKPLPCDDFEAYELGHLGDQSSLIKSWDPGQGGFDFEGDEEISDEYAQSGTQSLRLYEGPVHGASGVMASGEELTSGKYAVDFAFNVTDTGGGFYEILHLVNAASAYIYLDQTTMTAKAWSNYDGTLLDSFRYNGGWNNIRHIIDLDNDTLWIQLNGMDINAGWQFFNGNFNPSYYGYRGMHFLTAPDNINVTAHASEFYIDDFCVSTYECPSPSALVLEEKSCTRAMVNWNEGQAGSATVIEYDSTGFTRGTGNIINTSLDYDTLRGLTPGETYDVYVGEICGYDTVFTGPLTFTLPTEAIADFTFTKEEPTGKDIEVRFDGSPSVAAETYTWIFNDSTTAEGVTTSHTFTKNGTFAVQLVISSDCGSDTISKSVEVSGISLSENILDRSLEVYPNPFNDKVQITFQTGSSENVILRLTDLSGKLIVQKKISDVNGVFRSEMDLNYLAKGSYMLQIKCGKMNVVKRIVRE